MKERKRIKGVFDSARCASRTADSESLIFYTNWDLYFPPKESVISDDDLGPYERRLVRYKGVYNRLGLE